MKVFISWSGEMSKELGEAVRKWLPRVIQQIKPYFTPNDIDKGSRWLKGISQELEASKIGIFCITEENHEKPWIMFEAGALSKQVDSSCICPILFDLGPTDIEGPLVQFQATPFSKKEMQKLLVTINKLFGESKLEDAILNDSFNEKWPQFEATINKILEKYKGKSKGAKPKRNTHDLVEEILGLTRSMARRVTPPSPASKLLRAFEFNPDALERHYISQMDGFIEYNVSYEDLCDLIKEIERKFTEIPITPLLRKKFKKFKEYAQEVNPSFQHMGKKLDTEATVSDDSLDPRDLAPLAPKEGPIKK